MYEPRVVTRSLIDRANQLGHEVTNLKLQKLLYIAHGTMLAVHGTPLVLGNFSAWKYGPVLEPIYHDLKVFGADSIKSSDFYIQNWGKLPAEDADSNAVIDAVVDHFGGWTGASLIDWSHLPNGPWNAVYKDNSKKIHIENKDIEKYFKKYVVQVT
jgi:uncharacterized phage-associated protein